jgi:protein gp37
MSGKSAIEWTESTWNPVTGCSKLSSGCEHCYAERLAVRLRAMGQANYREGFRIALHEHALALPLRWKKPQSIFVNSMSDLFHPEVPLDFIKKVFAVMVEAGWHQFQILTKRAGRLEECANQLPWPENVWIGVSVENGGFAGRLDCLRKVPAAVRFASLEPLLGPIPDLNLEGIDWVIVGGESGPGARPVEADWIRGIREQCRSAGVPFFFKQWGGVRKKAAGRRLDGQVHNETPRRKVASGTGA